MRNVSRFSVIKSTYQYDILRLKMASEIRQQVESLELRIAFSEQEFEKKSKLLPYIKLMELKTKLYPCLYRNAYAVPVDLNGLLLSCYVLLANHPVTN